MPRSISSGCACAWRAADTTSPRTASASAARTSLLNLIILMPRLAQLRAYDNSVDVAVGTAVPEPRLVLGMDQGRLTFPITPDDIRATPDWAKALVAAAG